MADFDEFPLALTIFMSLFHTQAVADSSENGGPAVDGLYARFFEWVHEYVAARRDARKM
ncbi:hypothetical protein AB0M20_39480 [Actinoplanes sp. NPDC051633]|uniref:hypothetical protein n=1 Tax=Actinoplanes sp. NPDC051633 TaxID=3155670 RepID=UPI00342D247F